MSQVAITLLLCVFLQTTSPPVSRWPVTVKPDVKPVLIKSVEPESSPEARAAHITGEVELIVIIDQTGHVVRPRVVRSLGFGLDERAVAAVRQYVFKPGLKDGQPVACDFYIDFYYW
jgi:TonB family protein